MSVINRLLKNIEQVIIGKNNEILQILKGIISGGHVLIEDVPGIGKTTLVKTIAKSLNLSYKRIQFTPDLMPSDITGISIYNQKTGEFEFKKGPVFANIILADEINRSSPKTQSALLEVMEEQQISEGTNTYVLTEPFVVIATQNSIEYEGTFKLPEAQLDRFMIKVKLGYVDRETESDILQIYKNQQPLDLLESVAGAYDIIQMQNAVRSIQAARPITDYIAQIADATRNSKYINLGISTRAAIALMKIAQASAYIENRDYVIPEDVKNNAVSVLNHRILLSPLARAGNVTSVFIINDIIRRIQVPGIRST